MITRTSLVSFIFTLILISPLAMFLWDRDFIIYVNLTLTGLLYFLMFGRNAYDFIDTVKNNRLPKILLITIGSLIVASLFTPFPLGAIQGVLFWISIFIIFVCAIYFVRNGGNKIYIYHSIIFTGIILVLLGISKYLTAEPQFTSIFYQHNVLAGYLLLPIFICLSLFKSCTLLAKKWIYGSIFVFLTAFFLLTFSRGAILSFLIAFLVYTVFQFKNSRKLNTLFMPILLFIMSVLLAYGIFSIKEQRTGVESPAMSSVYDVYKLENIKQNAITARLNYYKTALDAFAEKPLTGYGLYNYRFAALEHRDTMEFYSLDAHNTVLRMFAEVGIWAIPYAIFILAIAIFCIGLIAKENEYRAIAAGLLAQIIHIQLDIDWIYGFVPITFFALLGTIVGSVAKQSTEESTSDLTNKVSSGVLIGAVSVMTVSGIIFLYNSRIIDDANYYQEKTKENQALVMNKTLRKWNPLIAESFYRESQIIFSTAGKDKNKHMMAKQSVENAIKLHKNNYNYYSLLGYIERSLGNTEEAVKNFQKVVELNPKGAINETRELAFWHINNKDYVKCLEVLEPMIANYPIDLFINAYWNHPDKAIIKKNIDGLIALSTLCQKAK